MRILYLYAHPLPESFHAAIRGRAIDGLRANGHEVDLLDLYAENFDPVLSEEGRRLYHDTGRNQDGIETYVARLRAADALIVQFPTWTFGMPAIMKGYFDRIMSPGIAFDLSDPARVRPLLHNIKRITGISTYGRPRWQALLMSDPPKRIVTRYLKWFAARGVRVDYHALYHMNVADDARRKAFLEKVHHAMRRF